MSTQILQNIAKSKATLSRLAHEARSFREEHPQAKGVSKFCNRIKRGMSISTLRYLLARERHIEIAMRIFGSSTAEGIR